MSLTLLKKLQVEVEIWEDEVPCCRDSWFGRLELGVSTERSELVAFLQG